MGGSDHDNTSPVRPSPNLVAAHNGTYARLGEWPALTRFLTASGANSALNQERDQERSPKVPNQEVVEEGDPCVARVSSGTPGGTRTPNLLIRSQALKLRTRNTELTRPKHHPIRIGSNIPIGRQRGPCQYRGSAQSRRSPAGRSDDRLRIATMLPTRARRNDPDQVLR